MKRSIRDRYREIKSALPRETMLMVRVGDYYEAMDNDAAQLAAIVGLPRRICGGALLCGVPYNELDAALTKLISAGKVVALCDQTESRHTITRVCSPWDQAAA